MADFAWGSGFASFDGMELEYVCHGPAPDQAMTIVMLHEGLGCVAMWRDLPEKIAAATGCGVLVYSRAGYGASSPVTLPRPIDYMTREAVDVLPKLLDGFGVRSCVLFGHSDGASIAAIYGGSVEDFRVRGLVLMAPHFFAEPFGLAAIEKARDAYNEGDLRAGLAKYHKDVDNAFRGWNDAWLNPTFYKWNIAEVIDYLRVPTLAIQGVDDEYGTMAQIDEIENRAYSPVDRLDLEDCGHSPHRDQPEKVMDAVTEFMVRLQRIEDEVVVPA